MITHPTIIARAGAPLADGGPRRRPVGRIGGMAGVADEAACNRLAAALGAGVQIVGEFGESLAADYDACFLDDRPIVSLDQWRAILTTGRLADVEGAFALAWREGADNLHLARDAVGERTLFYAPIPNGLIFASSLRAILMSGSVPRRLNLRAVAAYLSYAYLPGRETLVEGIFELLPGEQLNWSPAELQRAPFWELPFPPIDHSSEQEQALRLRALLEEAIRRRLPSPDEPVGAFLSGGLDSSLVVALARQLHRAPIHTYSVSFGAGHANELPFSSLVAEHCGTIHRVVELSPAVVLHHLDDSVGLLGDPIGDPLTVPNSLLFREAAAEVGVVLNGEGGDPCFGGPKNLPMVMSELYQGAPGGRKRETSYLRAHLKCYDDLPAMLADPVRDALAVAPLEDELSAVLHDPKRPDLIARLQAINIRLKGGHHILPKVDALSFPSGILPRSPLFDRAVVERSVAIPAQLKLHGSVEKYLLKRAVDDLLPPVIIERPKSGMLVPVEGWFRGPLLPAARERLLDGLRPYHLFRPEYLERLLAGELGGLRPRHGAKTWLLVTLEAWLRRVFEP